MGVLHLIKLLAVVVKATEEFDAVMSREDLIGGQVVLG